MESYLKLLEDVVENGSYKPSGRKGMPGTYSVFGRQLRFSMSNGFPILTTKKVSFKNIYYELLWFLSGETRVSELSKRGVNIWNKDAHRVHVKECEDRGITPKDYEEFVWAMNYGHEEGYLGKVYGYQWRNFGGILDQLGEVIEGLQDNPYGRRHIVSAWNPLEVSEMGLPPCHVLFQFQVMPPKDGGKPILNLMMYQRSCDLFLGVPYNISSYALLLSLIADHVGYVEGDFVWSGADVHVYENHLEAANTQIGREPFELPLLNIVSNPLGHIDSLGYRPLDYDTEDVCLLGYQHHPPIKAELSVGNS